MSESNHTAPAHHPCPGCDVLIPLCDERCWRCQEYYDRDAPPKTYWLVPVAIALSMLTLMGTVIYQVWP